MLDTNEIISSINGSIKKRFHTPLYGTFTLAWVAFHWEFLYTTFFVNQNLIYQKTGLLKNVYLHRTFFNYSSFDFYWLWVLPLIVTWLIIWVLPRFLLLPAFRKDQEYRTEQRRITLVEEKKIEEAETKLEEANVKKLDVTTEKVRKEKEIVELDPTALWNEEYIKFHNDNKHLQLPPIMEAVYEHGGSIRVEGEFANSDPDFEVPMFSLVAADTNDLIAFNESHEKISLTDKGKYFIKQYTSPNQGILTSRSPSK